MDFDIASFPDAWEGEDDSLLELRYEWGTGSADDGVQVVVPLAHLEQLAADGLEWQVPGLREELVVALLRSLPKDVRRHLVPIPDRAKEFVAKTRPEDGQLLSVLAKDMSIASGVAISVRDFDWEKVPPYLRPTFQVVGEQEEVLAVSKDLGRLLTEVRPQLEAALQAAAIAAGFGAALGAEPSSTWDFGELPKVFDPAWHGYRLRGYPALVDAGDGVRVHVFPDEARAREAMMAATRRLLLLNLPSRRQLADGLQRRLGNNTSLALGALANPPYPSTRAVAEDAIVAALDLVVNANGGPAWGKEEFDRLVQVARQQVSPAAERAVAAAKRIIFTVQDQVRRIEKLSLRLPTVWSAAPSPMGEGLRDIGDQLEFLARPNFMSSAGLDRLADIERYLSAIDRRLDKLPADPQRDLALTGRVRLVQRRLDEALASSRAAGAGQQQLSALGEVRWMIEELRVSFFAQSLGTRMPVSEQKISKVINEALSGATTGNV